MTPGPAAPLGYFSGATVFAVCWPLARPFRVHHVSSSCRPREPGPEPLFPSARLQTVFVGSVRKPPCHPALDPGFGPLPVPLLRSQEAADAPAAAADPGPARRNQDTAGAADSTTVPAGAAAIGCASVVWTVASPSGRQSRERFADVVEGGLRQPEEDRSTGQQHPHHDQHGA